MFVTANSGVGSTPASRIGLMCEWSIHIACGSALTEILGIRNIRRAMSTANDYPPSKSSPVLPMSGTIRADQAECPSVTLQTKKAFLTVIRGIADLGMHAFIETRTIVGRDPTCRIALHDHRASRQHAAITPYGGDVYLVEDLGSTNGTRVNGTPIGAPHRLNDGDKIFVGETIIRFALADEMDVRFQNEVATLVGTDPLTGLPSKRRFDDALQFALRTAQQTGEPLSVLMMDMDGVKQINDTHGHLFGAYVIGETGRLIAKVIANRGRACRFGGDEFSAFLPGRDLLSAQDIAEQIRHAVEMAAMEKEDVSLRPTISIGVACFPDSGQDLLDLTANADKALYRAKGQGKNCVAV